MKKKSGINGYNQVLLMITMGLIAIALGLLLKILVDLWRAGVLKEIFDILMLFFFTA